MNDEQTPALRQAVENMITMREAYDNLSQAAEAYNTGKVQLAANITEKGVPASASETLPELADKVSAIAQQPIILSPSEVGDMYAMQQFGSLTTPNYWNLYEVLNTLLNDGRLLNYGGIVLAEYNKGYDSIFVQSADAFVFSDIKDGQFELYDESISTTHIWNDNENGKINRWVAYCFVNEDSNFNILDTNTSPRSIFIGKKVGTITLCANSRTSEIIVPDGNKLGNINSKTYTFQFSKKTVIRNLGNQVSGKLLYQPNNVLESLYIEGDKLSNAIVSNPVYNTSNDSALSNITLVSSHFDNCYILDTSRSDMYLPALNIIIIKGSGTLYMTQQAYCYFSNLKTITVIAEDITFTSRNLVALNSTVKFYLQYMTNDKSKSVVITEGFESWKNIADFELQDGWCKPLTISKFIGLTKANVQAHIFDKLGVNDLSTGAITITLANAVLSLFTQEEIDAVVERTNITIVGA